MMIKLPTIIRAGALTIRNLNGYDHLISNGPCIQCVRWKRKPIWLPTAKTKVFRVPKRPVLPDEEKAELMRLSNNYRTYMTSLKQYFFETQSAIRREVKEKTAVKNVEEEFAKSKEINDYWNKQVAMERELRYAKEREEREKEIKLKLEQQKQRQLETRIRVDTEIRKLKEEAVTFITRNNIDEAIEKALQTTVDPNEAIDLNGNIYTEDYTKTSPTQSSTESTM